MDLRRRLEAACRRGGFISIAALHQIVNERAVNQYLLHSASILPYISHASLSESILRDARKMFAVLVKCDLGRYVGMLTQGRMSDDKFPIHDKSNLPIPNDHDLKKIRECQWEIAPLWKTGVHLEIPKHLKIKFDDLFEMQPRPNVDRGSYGIINQIKIKKGHIEDYGPDQLFAKKTITISKGTEQREADILLRRKHQHIVPVVVTYTDYWRSSKTAEPSQKVLVIITPWYSASLRQILDAPPQRGSINNGRMYEYVYQILQGLAYLHAPQQDQALTSHHDLKPENILIDLVEGKAAMTDFGMGHLKPMAEGSAVTSYRALGTCEYAPPEAFDERGGRSKKQHGRAFDMWSMGCIMMEIAVLICYGYYHETKNIKAFRDECEKLPADRRPFPEHGTSAKSFYNSIPVIDDWLKMMQSDGIFGYQDNKMFLRYLCIMIKMLRGEPGARVLSWEAVLEFYDLLHPDASDTERFLKGKELVQKPGKSILTKTPLHRAAENGDLIWVLCLVDAGWSDNVKDDQMKTPSDLAKEKGYVDIEHYLRHKSAQAEVPPSPRPCLDFVHDVENTRHGLQMNKIDFITSTPPLPDVWPPLMRARLLPVSTEIKIPEDARRRLRAFVTNPEKMTLCFYKMQSGGWVNSASSILSYQITRANQHVILFDYRSSNFPHGHLMTALQCILTRLKASPQPIVLMILNLYSNGPHDEDLKDLRLIIEASRSKEELKLHKIFVTSTGQRPILPELLGHIDVTNWRNQPQRIWSAREMSESEERYR